MNQPKKQYYSHEQYNPNRLRANNLKKIFLPIIPHKLISKILQYSLICLKNTLIYIPIANFSEFKIIYKFAHKLNYVIIFEFLFYQNTQYNFFYMLTEEIDHRFLIEEIWVALNQFIKCPSSKKLRNHFQIEFQKIRLNLENYNHIKLIYAVLQIPFKVRTNQMYNKLDECFGQFEYFRKLNQKYGQKCKNKIYSQMVGNIYKKGKRITKVGQQSDNFFIILKGEVIVLYSRDPKQINADTIKVKSEISKQLSKKAKILSRIENHYYFKGIYIEEIQDYQQYFNCYGIPLFYVENILTKGKSFGQLGIIYRQKRMANIISKQQSLIATISAQKYLSLVAENEGQEINEMLLFLQEYFYSGLKDMELFKAQRYYYIFTKIQRKINSTIFTSQSQVNGFYLVVEGSVVLKMEEQQSQKQRYGRHYPSFMKQNQKKKLLDFKNLIYGQSFGLQEIVDCIINKKQKSFYKYTAITTSHAKLLFCPLTKLIKLIKFDKNLMIELQEKILKKQKLHKIQKQNIELSRNITALSLNFNQKNKVDGYNQQFPMRFFIKKTPPDEIRSPIFSKKFESLNLSKTNNVRPNSSSVDNCITLLDKSATILQKENKNKKLWKKNCDDQSSLLINIINDKIKLFKKMKEESTKPKKKFIKYKNNFVKKAPNKNL